MLTLSVQALALAYGQLQVLDGVTFHLRAGQTTGLVGSNGSGKSTLLRVLAGQQQPDSGWVRRAPAVRLGYLPQQDEDLDPDHNTLFGAFCSGLGFPQAEAARAELFRLGLFHYEDIGKLVSHLSGGERRRLQIARLIAICCCWTNRPTTSALIWSRLLRRRCSHSLGRCWPPHTTGPSLRAFRGRCCIYRRVS